MTPNPFAEPMPVGADVLKDMLFRLCGASRDVGIIFLDTRGRIRAWRGGVEGLLGYCEEEVLDKHISLIFTPEDVALGLDTQELRAAEQDGSSDDDRWHVRKDGARIWVCGSMVALRSEQGELLGYGKVVTDRTDLIAQLDLLKDQLQTDRQMREAQNRFYARICHEIRNSLAPLRSAVEVMRLEPSGEQKSFTLGLLDRQLTLLSRMVQDLRNGIQVGVAGPQLNLHRLDLTDFLQRCAELVLNQMREKDLGFHYLLPQGPLRVQADPERLQQAVYNLLDNAIKFTPAGGAVSLRLSVESGDAVIRIHDTGMGISADALPKLLSGLSQDVRRTRNAVDSGLGLGIVTEIVQAHGGVVEVRSSGLGKGSEFTICLPILQDT